MFGLVFWTAFLPLLQQARAAIVAFRRIFCDSISLSSTLYAKHCRVQEGSISIEFSTILT
jgi:hypothetical protein